MSDDREPAGSNAAELPTESVEPAAAPSAATPAETPAAAATPQEMPVTAAAPEAAAAAAAPTETAPADAMPQEMSATPPAPARPAETPAASTASVAALEEEEEQRESRQREAFGAMLEKFDGTKQVDDAVEVGRKITGRIVQIGEESAFVDFGGRSEGAVETHHLKGPDGAVKYAIGDEIELFVVAAGDQILLAPSIQLKADAALDTVKDAKAKGVPVSGKVASINAGGLEVHVGGLRGFCPFSQIESGFCAEPSAYLGQTLEFLVQEVGDGGKNLVLSRRALLRREEKAQAGKLLETLKEGVELNGRVTRIQPFGAFVAIGGLEGLVHVSEIQHGHVTNPNDVLRPGQEVRVRVLRLEKDDKGRLRIGLSIKAAQPDPWVEIAEQFWQGKKTQGTVARMQDFGAFVELVPGIDGLVHVSEIAHTPVKHPKDVLTVGQRVDVTVLNVDVERKRISLSIKDQIERPAPATGEGEAQRGAVPEKQPAVGDVVDGVVANIKPYGLFVDLPIYGARVRGLCPREETGERRGTDLSQRFSPGTPLKVAVIEVQPDGKIRLSVTALQSREEREQYEGYRRSASGGGPGGAPGGGQGGRAGTDSGGGNRTGGAVNTAMAEAFKKAMQKTSN